MGLLSFLKPSVKVTEQFKVRTVTLENGKQYFFPEHRKHGGWGTWNTIVLINNKHVTTVTSIVENEQKHSCESMDEAKALIKRYADELKAERANFVSSTEELDVDIDLTPAL